MFSQTFMFSLTARTTITLHFISSLVFTHAHLFLFSCTVVHRRWFVFCLYLSPQHCHWLFLTGTLTLPYPLVGLHCTIVTLFLLSVVHVCQDQCDFSHEHLQTKKKKKLALRAYPYRIIFLHHCLHLLLNLLLLHFCNKRSPSGCFLTGKQHPFLVIRAKFSEAIQHFDAICTGSW